MLRTSAALATAALLTFSSPAHAAELEIDKGTIEIGGFTTFSIDSFGNTTRASFQLAPQVGYWLSERFEILASINMLITDSFQFGLAAGVQYNILDPGVWTPYVGVLGGFTAGNNLTRGAVVPMGGVMFAVNRAIALDLGVRVNIGFGEGGLSVNVPIGWLGVRAFFPIKDVTEKF